jgi:hypothetical protein
MYSYNFFLYTYFIMSSRSKMFGAGLAGSSSYGVNPNLNTSGGDKKQGFAPLVGLSSWSNRSILINANGQNKTHNVVFCMNQLGGVGAAKSQFGTATSAAKPDGVQRKAECGKLFSM